ncbi:DUF6318 family protein [Aeromicrobium flavum]
MIAVVAALALTLSACSEDDPPPPDPTSAATAPANPDATLPPMPEVASEFTPNGASTFVRYYVGVLSYAGQTGDVDELTRLSDSNCGGCSDYIRFFRETYAGGGWIRGRTWVNGDTQLWFDSSQDGETRATTSVRIAAGTLKPDSESNPTNAPASAHKVTFGLTFDGNWTMTQLVSGDPS